MIELGPLTLTVHVAPTPALPGPTPGAGSTAPHVAEPSVNVALTLWSWE